MDDICHCSCGGVNHGILRTAGGVQPVRSRKHQGRFWELEHVCHGHGEKLKLYETHPETINQFDFLHTTATTSEIMKWPELTAYRNQTPVQRMMKPVLLVWKLSTRYGQEPKFISNNPDATSKHIAETMPDLYK